MNQLELKIAPHVTYIAQNAMMVKIEIDNKIIVLLENTLVKPSNGLKEIYDRIKAYYNRSLEINVKPTQDDLHELNEILPNDLLSKHDLVGGFSYLKQEEIRTIAIDFPILISNNFNKKKIMICALDSLPPNIGGITESINVWAPFSLNYNWNLATKSSKQNIIFFNTLLECANLYVTDLYKLFFRRGLEGTDNRSNQDHYYTSKNVETHKYILEQEIEIIKPDLILTLGNNSRNVIYSITNTPVKKWDDDIMSGTWLDGVTKIVSIPHISGAANGAKSKLLKNSKYENIQAKGNKKLAHILLSEID